MTAKEVQPIGATEPLNSIWRIELLGGVCLRHQERVLHSFKTRRMTILLARLACFPERAHPRDTLAEELWPDEEPDTLRERFRQTLSMLRRELEPEGTVSGSVLSADRSTVRLSPGSFSTDVADFTAHCRLVREEPPSRQLEMLQQAERLYKGELLPGFYEDWIQTEREHLAEQHRQALSRLTQAYGNIGQFDAAIEIARKVIASDPLREDAHGALIRVFAQAGRQTDAKKQYEELELLLRREVDAEPSMETTRLMEQVRSGNLLALPKADALIVPAALSATSGAAAADPPSISTSVVPPVSPPMPALAPAPPLPASLTRFFGREEEIAHLLSLLQPTDSLSSPQPSTRASTRREGYNPQPGASPLVSLIGPGGAGKTRLALETARRLLPAYDGAAWFVPLADIAHPGLIADALVETLGIARSAHAAPIEQAIEFLQAYPAALLILDNFEHLQEEGTPFVQTLRQNLPRLSCLVTSRHKLNVYGERDIALTTTANAGHIRSARNAGRIAGVSVRPTVFGSSAGCALLVPIDGEQCRRRRHARTALGRSAARHRTGGGMGSHPRAGTDTFLGCRAASICL